MHIVGQAQYHKVAEKADNLRELRINLNNWMQSHKNKEFAASDEVQEGVRKSMLRPGSVLRVIGIGCMVYRVRICLCGRPVLANDLG